jgi:hypothetical protein
VIIRAGLDAELAQLEDLKMDNTLVGACPREGGWIISRQSRTICTIPVDRKAKQRLSHDDP